MNDMNMNAFYLRSRNTWTHFEWKRGFHRKQGCYAIGNPRGVPPLRALRRGAPGADGRRDVGYKDTPFIDIYRCWVWIAFCWEFPFLQCHGHWRFTVIGNHRSCGSNRIWIGWYQYRTIQFRGFIEVHWFDPWLLLDAPVSDKVAENTTWFRRLVADYTCIN